MNSEQKNTLESKDSLENLRRNSKDNTEYVPTRCRITKPIPPKPATNPMQFVKIGPCELYRKAQEQLKKVEEVKSVRQEIRDDAEDWQANLDNWKSSRRKRQEHIIERVVEVKKYGQQENERTRRKSKTFNEILEERSKRKNKLSITVYNDDSNDLSDYGLGAAKNEHEADQNEISNMKNDDSVQPNEDDSKIDENNVYKVQMQREQNVNNNESKIPLDTSNNSSNILLETSNENDDKRIEECENVQEEPEQYTYESAIQSYRTRVISKNNLSSVLRKPVNNNNNTNDTNETGTTSSTISDVEGIYKGSISKRKEIFENDRLYELNHFESNTSRRLSEDFINSQSLKERLLSLGKYTDQSLCQFSSTTDNSDIKNNNTSKLSSDQSVRNRVTMINHLNEPDFEEFETQTKPKSVICNNWSNRRFDSPEHEMYVNQLENKIHRSLGNLTDSTNECTALERVQSLEGLEYYNSNYPASNSSAELLTYGDTDREDSGIHTADVSCSVSQADEPVDDMVIEEETKCTGSNAYPVMQFEEVFASEDFPLGPPVTALEPPKEKPPPPPVSEPEASDISNESELKRLNSTKRIQKEIRMKRSSFLGIDPNVDNQPELDATIRKPPDINSFLQRESLLEKQMYKNSQLQPITSTQSNYCETGDSQDSGVELERGRLSSDTWCSSLANTYNHSRQNSEPCITSDEDDIIKKEREIIELVEKEEKWRDNIDCDTCTSKISQIKQQHQQMPGDYVTSEDDEHSEVLRVEHELLQLEREELERQRGNILFRESRARAQSKPCLKSKGLSLEDISDVSNQPHGYMYQSKSNVDYRKSMPELQREVNMANSRPQILGSNSSLVMPKKAMQGSFESDLYLGNSKSTHRMSSPLQKFSTPSRPRPLPQDKWINPQLKPLCADSREKLNYNQHWLIQEAEQRRLSAQSNANWKLSRSEKHLPDSIIQTLTQRVQNKLNLSDRNLLTRNVPHSPHSVGHALPLHHPHFAVEDSPDKMLSVSGKKKCSYCGNELGRGAAMIIESLCLFYHMDCFKCCVCHVQLGDGLMGTDVRVRNNKLHCHNCYSSDDGVKFSCV